LNFLLIIIDYTIVKIKGRHMDNVNELVIGNKDMSLVKSGNTGLISAPQEMSVFDNELVMDPVEQYLLSLNSPASTRTVETRIKECARIWHCTNRQGIAWEKINKSHVLGLIKTMVHEKKKLATIKNTLSCLKGVIREAYDLDIVTSENFNKIISVRPPRGEQVAHGKALNIESIHTLFSFLAALDDPIGVRDNAIVKLLITTGLRRAEVTHIEMRHFNVCDRTILILGKGNKERTVGLNQSCFDAITHWIKAQRGQESGFLFSRIRKGGQICLKEKISDQSIYNIAKLRTTQAGLEGIATHDLRRTFATHMLENGTDLNDVMKMMGHASPETTKRYDKSGDKKALDIMKNSPF
jgi:site-specific recombinase XerD